MATVLRQLSLIVCARFLKCIAASLLGLSLQNKMDRLYLFLLQEV